MKDSSDGRPRNRPVHRGLAGLLAGVLLAAGPASADVIADFNLVGARTVNTAPGAYPAVTPEERRTVLGSAPRDHAHGDVRRGRGDRGRLRALRRRAGEPECGGFTASCGGGRRLHRARGAVSEPVAGVRGGLRAVPRWRRYWRRRPRASRSASKSGKRCSLNVPPTAARPSSPTRRSAVSAASSLSRRQSPALVLRAGMRPFTLTSAMQFRADGPPGLTSASYAVRVQRSERSVSRAERP